jgi:CheY-like chemotaxis protein
VEGSPLDTKPAVARPAAPAEPEAEVKKETGTSAPKAGIEETLDLLLHEVRAVREAQDSILRGIDELREARASAPGAPADFQGFGGAEGPAFSPIRDGQAKTVLLVDDDPQTREAAVAEFRRAEVPVRALDDGNAALSAIAERRPDVIVLELGLGGEMGGKDLVNMVKATMEWVDIPIVLWTREAALSQKEARQVHGADEIVPKASGAAALVARVINVFRR